MNTATTIPHAGLYSRERCKALRGHAVAQARKHKDAGRSADATSWLGYALYWSTRARTGLKPDDAQAAAYARGKRYNVRSVADMAATRVAAVASMNAPGFVPSDCVTGSVA